MQDTRANVKVLISVLSSNLSALNFPSEFLIIAPQQTTDLSWILPTGPGPYLAPPP